MPSSWSGSIAICLASAVCLPAAAPRQTIESRLLAVVNEVPAPSGVIVDAAEWVLAQALRASEVGLAKWRSEGLKVCRIARLADRCRDPRLKLLGIECHRALARVLATEVYRAELTRIGFSAPGIKPRAGVDTEALRELLAEDTVDEREQIAAVLALDGQLTARFREMGGGSTVLADGGMDRRLRAELDEVRHRVTKATAGLALTRYRVGDVLLVSTLEVIQDLRDIRIALGVFLADGSLGDDLAELKAKLSRAVGPDATRRASDGTIQRADKVHGTFTAYSNARPGYFEGRLLFPFAAFLRDRTVVPASLRSMAGLLEFGVLLKLKPGRLAADDGDGQLPRR